MDSNKHSFGLAVGFHSKLNSYAVSLKNIFQSGLSLSILTGLAISRKTAKTVTVNREKGLATKVKVSRSLVRNFSSTEALLLHNCYNSLFCHRGMKLKIIKLCFTVIRIKLLLFYTMIILVFAVFKNGDHRFLRFLLIAWKVC